MRYYGGKSKLLPFIESAVSELALPNTPTFVDLFSGTSVVGRHFKERGFGVVANDSLYFCKCLATARVVLNTRPTFSQLAEDPIDVLNALNGEDGFFSQAYSPSGIAKRRYFSERNARQIEAVRHRIENWRVSNTISQLEAEYLIAALLEAANLTSNVSGTYAAFLKSWDSRALNRLTLRHPEITVGQRDCEAFQSDAIELVEHVFGDVFYLDPPYNTRQYSSNYFLLDIIAHGWFTSTPQVRGVTGMRDNSGFKSAFSSRRTAADALEKVVSKAKCRYLLLSYNNEGIIPQNEIIDMFQKYGRLNIKEFEHRRYKAVNHDPLRDTTTEYLFILRKDF